MQPEKKKTCRVHLIASIIGLAIIFNLFFANDTRAQQDTLNKRDIFLKLSQTKDIKKRISLMQNLFWIYASEGNEDSLEYYNNEAIQLCRAGNLINFEAGCYGQIGAYYISRVNYSKGLSSFFKSLKLSEKIRDTAISIQLLINIGGVYFDLDDVNNAVRYTKDAARLAKAQKDSFYYALSILIIGNYFNETSQPDSSLAYIQEGSLLSDRIKDSSGILVSFSQSEMGRYHRLAGNDEIALSYFKRSLENTKHKGSMEFYTIRAFNYLGMSLISERRGNPDTAIYYTRLAKESAYKFVNPKMLQMVYRQLAQQFAMVNKDSSIYYYQKESAVRDSLLNLKNLNDIKNLTLAEEERMKERDELQRELLEKEKIVLEYAATGLTAIVLIMLFLLLSRTFIVNEKLIRFLGVMVLLIVFEFINLLIHPLLGSVTHHSPALMLLGMVILAALLVPAHHRMEKWLVHKVVEKNKRIRLRAARKIIQELEKPEET